MGTRRRRQKLTERMARMAGRSDRPWYQKPAVQGLCSYYDQKALLRVDWDFVYGSAPPFKNNPYKLKYGRCPECGRRVQLKNWICDDQCCFEMLIPPHRAKVKSTRAPERRRDRKNRERRGTVRGRR